MRIKAFLQLSLVVLSALSHANVAALTTCNVAQVSGLAFGKIVPFLNQTTNAEALIRIRCEVIGTPPVGNQVSAAIRISQGNSLSYAPRNMFNSAGLGIGFQIEYNLFTQAVGGSIWGDGTGATSEVTLVIPGLSANGAISEVPRVIYGRLPDIPNTKEAGLYTDVLIISISY